MICWDDLRYFLAIARTGSTLAAARELRVSQTTAARRVAALEEATGLVLFERRQAGYALTPAGAALVAQAEAVAASGRAFEDAAAAQAREVSGTVRLTAVEIYSIVLLTPILKELHLLYPAIRIELDASDETRDLAAGEADIALRNAKRLDGAGLVARRIGPDPWTIYCSRAYAAAHRRPRTAAELRHHPFIGGGGAGLWRMYRAWLQRHGLEDAVVMQHSSLSGLLAAVRAGVGLSVLSSFAADRDPDLVQCLPPREGDESALWLVTHERVRHTPRVRAVMDYLGDRLARVAREKPVADRSDEVWGPQPVFPAAVP